MASLSRRLTTLWFADIAGFTRLSATDEALALRVMEVMRRCVKRAVAQRHGTVIKFLGDGALAEFPSAEGAVLAALDAGARFKGSTRALAGGPYLLHTGIHVGDVFPSEDGDVFGDGVNRAQRVESLGEPGQTLVSEEAYRLVRRQPNLTFQSLGQHTVKGLDEPFEVFLVGAQGDLARQLEQLEQSPSDAGPLAGDRPAKRAPAYSRALGLGIAGGVATFGIMAVWTALGGRPDEAGTGGRVAIPDTLPMPRHDSALAMPSWPPRAPLRAVRAAAPASAPSAAGRASSLVELAAAGERYLARRGPTDLAAHELLPILRRALNEARDGAPRGPRAEAVRGTVLFVVAHDVGAADRAFQASIAAAPTVGLTRVTYARLLTAAGRFQEAQAQLEAARGKEVSNAELDAARGALLFRRGEYGDARSALDRALKVEDVLATRLLLARAQIAQNKTNDALRTLDQRIGSPEVVPWMAYARLRGEGDKPGAGRPQLLDMARRASAGYAGALILFHAGQLEESLAALQRLAAAGDPDLVWLGVDPEWAALRGHARFQALVARAAGRR